MIGSQASINDTVSTSGTENNELGIDKILGMSMNTDNDAVTIHFDHTLVPMEFLICNLPSVVL